jgi:hypothetical protein
VPCSAQHLDAVQIAVEQIDVIKRLVEKYPNELSLVSSVKGMVLIWKGGKYSESFPILSANYAVQGEILFLYLSMCPTSPSSTNYRQFYIGIYVHTFLFTQTQKELNY